MIEYIAETHTYLKDGVIIPSVTQIIHKMMPNKYSGIPARVLEKAAAYGDLVHESIEDYNRTGIVPENEVENVIKRYRTIAEANKITVASQEEIVSYKDMFAGRYDILGSVKEKPAIIDIKTTSTYDDKYLSIQLTMYRMALREAGIDVEKAYCMYLPKKKTGMLIQVKFQDETELIKKIENVALDNSEE